jgi:hypothetical protein
MKSKLLILMLCLLLCKLAMAQKDSLAFDEHGKYIYYRVVNDKKNDANVLLVRALDFFDMPGNRHNFKITAKDANTHNIDVTGFFIVSKASTLAKHDDGKITFNIRVEIKDQKYRYWLNGFVFTPYMRDRYNNMVPQPGIEIPMEVIAKKEDKKDADHYLNECGAFARKLSSRLKQYMLTGPVVSKQDTTKKVIRIENW